MPVLTDVHEVCQVEETAKVVDVLQIPAFLCRQTDLVLAAADTGKAVNIKKGQFLSPYDMGNIISKATSTGNENVLVTERGACFGYGNLVVDMRSFPIMSQFGYPVIFDATHSVQRPGGLGTATGGDREFVPHLVRAACAVGIDALFLEVHPNPDKALSDAATMLPLSELRSVLVQALRVREASPRVGHVSEQLGLLVRDRTDQLASDGSGPIKLVFLGRIPYSGMGSTASGSETSGREYVPNGDLFVIFSLTQASALMQQG